MLSAQMTAEVSGRQGSTVHSAGGEVTRILLDIGQSGSWPVRMTGDAGGPRYESYGIVRVDPALKNHKAPLLRTITGFYVISEFVFYGGAFVLASSLEVLTPPHTFTNKLMQAKSAGNPAVFLMVVASTVDAQDNPSHALCFIEHAMAASIFLTEIPSQWRQCCLSTRSECQTLVEQWFEMYSFVREGACNVVSLQTEGFRAADGKGSKRFLKLEQQMVRVRLPDDDEKPSTQPPQHSVHAPSRVDAPPVRTAAVAARKQFPADHAKAEETAARAAMALQQREKNVQKRFKRNARKRKAADSDKIGKRLAGWAAALDEVNANAAQDDSPAAGAQHNDGSPAAGEQYDDDSPAAGDTHQSDVGVPLLPVVHAIPPVVHAIPPVVHAIPLSHASPAIPCYSSTAHMPVQGNAPIAKPIVAAPEPSEVEAMHQSSNVSNTRSDLDALRDLFSSGMTSLQTMVQESQRAMQQNMNTRLSKIIDERRRESQPRKQVTFSQVSDKPPTRANATVGTQAEPTRVKATVGTQADNTAGMVQSVVQQQQQQQQQCQPPPHWQDPPMPQQQHQPPQYHQQQHLQSQPPPSYSQQHHDGHQYPSNFHHGQQPLHQQQHLQHQNPLSYSQQHHYGHPYPSNFHRGQQHSVFYPQQQQASRVRCNPSLALARENLVDAWHAKQIREHEQAASANVAYLHASAEVRRQEKLERLFEHPADYQSFP